MLSSTKASALASLMALYAGQVICQDASKSLGPWSSGSWTIADKDAAQHHLDVSRDMTVPAKCWDNPSWEAENQAYIRDRFMLDWSKRGLDGNMEYIITLHIWKKDGSLKSTASTSLDKIVKGTKALAGVNKFANNHVFIRTDPNKFGEAERESAAGSPKDIVDRCNKEADCIAIEIPPSDEIISIGFSVSRKDYQGPVGEKDPSLVRIEKATDATSSEKDGKDLVHLCDDTQWATGTLPPMKRRVRRTAVPRLAKSDSARF